MTFRQERLIFDGGDCVLTDEKILVSPYAPSYGAQKVYIEENGYTFMKEEEYLNKIAEEGWVLHTANYCVLGKQEAHYFLFVKE